MDDAQTRHWHDGSASTQTMPRTPSQRPVQPSFRLSTSRGFLEWLEAERVSIAVSTYQVGKLLLFGVKPDGRMSIHASSFDRAIGMYLNDQTGWLATRNMLWRLENCVAQGQQIDSYDRVFVPRMGYLTGDLDIHDISVDAARRPIFVNTRFCCLATVDEQCSFTPLWKPPFLSKLCPEDRCHLNGLAMQEGKPKYVTVCAESDVTAGWRDFKRDGGRVLDVETDEVVAAGLSMPHSPRLHAGKLWLLNTGAGEFGFVDLATGRFEPIVFVPGFARGLTFFKGYAIIGLSKPRNNERTFQDLPLDGLFAAKGCAPVCGFQIIELASGACVHWGRLEGAIHELFDVVALPGVRLAKSMGFGNPALGQQLCAQVDGSIEYWSSQAA